MDAALPLAFHRTMTDDRLRDGLLTGLFLALQTLSSWYYGIFFASFLVPVFAALVMGARRGQGLRALSHSLPVPCWPW